MASVAGMALEHGINANLLRKWIDDYRKAAASVTAEASLPAFAPVVPIAMVPEPAGSALSVMFPNGIKLELRGIGSDGLPPLLSCLAGLPCSASNRA